MNIIDMPHFHDSKRPFMSMHDRAGQFMPFKSLRGFDDDINDKTKGLLDQEWEKIIYDEEYDPDRSLDDDGDV